VVLSKASRVTDGMFHAAAHAAAHFVSEEDLARGALLPPLEDIRKVSASIAAAVVRLAQSDGLATVPIPDDLDAWVRAGMYEPNYVSYV
jgi:malic enzyme